MDLAISKVLFRILTFSESSVMRPFIFATLALLFVGEFALADKPADDSQRPELVIIGEPGNALEQTFASHEGLRTIRNNCLYTPLKLTDKLYQLRYASVISGTPPMVLLQRPGGGVIWSADINSLPYTSDAIYEAIKVAYEKARVADSGSKQDTGITQDCPDGSCPLPNQIDAPELNLNPFDFAKPQPAVGGWFSDTVSWMMIVIGVTIALGFMLIFGLIALGVVLLLNRFIS